MTRRKDQREQEASARSGRKDLTKRGDRAIPEEMLFANWRREIDELLAKAGEIGVNVDPRAPERLLRFCREVRDYSRIGGLVSKDDLPFLVKKHVAASLGVLTIETPSPDELWIDVGSGGGFPGMVVKICRPDARIVLLDSSLKKTEFLQRAGRELGLEELRVMRGRVEEIARPAHAHHAVRVSCPDKRYGCGCEGLSSS